MFKHVGIPKNKYKNESCGKQTYVARVQMGRPHENEKYTVATCKTFLVFARVGMLAVCRTLLDLKHI